MATLDYQCHRDRNQQRYLGNAAPLGGHRVRVLVKGQAMASMAGPDLDALKARAFNFASAQGWHRAVVEVIA